jgi:hypothetical protein
VIGKESAAGYETANKGRGIMKKILFLFSAFLLLSCVIGTHKVYAQEIEADSIVVEGRILRPQAAYIIQRANVEFGIEAKKRSFVQKIESSLDEPPFK